jgi:hypothetical protein
MALTTRQTRYCGHEYPRVWVVVETFVVGMELVVVLQEGLRISAAVSEFHYAPDSHLDFVVYVHRYRFHDRETSSLWTGPGY